MLKKFGLVPDQRLDWTGQISGLREKLFSLERYPNLLDVANFTVKRLTTNKRNYEINENKPESYLAFL